MGGLQSRPRPGRGGARNPGCQPPRKPKRRWGRGRRPRPLPSLAAGGGGKHRGRAATSAALGLAGPGHVSAPPTPTATRARFPNVPEGRVRGPGGCACPGLCPETPGLAVPGLPRACGRPLPPPPRLSVRVQQGCHSPETRTAQAQGCDRTGRGGGGRAGVRRLRPPPRASGAGWERAMGGAGAPGLVARRPFPHRGGSRFFRPRLGAVPGAFRPECAGPGP